MQRVRMVQAALLLTIFSACGGGSSSTEKPEPANDRVTAQKANLQAADLPAGWSSKPHEKLPMEDELSRDVAKCLGISDPSSRASAEVRSPDFTSGLATASSSVTFVSSEEEATKDAAAFTSGEFAKCALAGLGEQMHQTAPPGNTVAELKMVDVALPTYGDRSVARRVTAKIKIGEAGEIPITIDLVKIFKGRAEVDINVVAPGQAFPEDFVAKLAAAVVARL